MTILRIIDGERSGLFSIGERRSVSCLELERETERERLNVSVDGRNIRGPKDMKSFSGKWDDGTRVKRRPTTIRELLQECTESS